jgi:hypothetical protein
MVTKYHQFLIEEFPKLSVIILSFNCVRRFLKKDLHLETMPKHEYHELKTADHEISKKI